MDQDLVWKRNEEFLEELANKQNMENEIPFEQRVSELNPAQFDTTRIKPDGQPIFLNDSTMELSQVNVRQSELIVTR